jgi:antitoxin (DNA-binding transcriptional repressor) of toxin-antitoxin stability system
MSKRVVIRRAGEPPKLLMVDPARGWEAFEAAALDTLELDAQTHAIAKVCLSMGSQLVQVKQEDVVIAVRDGETLELTVSGETVATTTEPPPAAAAPTTPGAHRSIEPAATRRDEARPSVPRAGVGASGRAVAKPKLLLLRGEEADDAKAGGLPPLCCMTLHTTPRGYLLVGETLGGGADAVEAQLTYLARQGVRTIISVVPLPKKHVSRERHAAHERRLPDAALLALAPLAGCRRLCCSTTCASSLQKMCVCV